MTEPVDSQQAPYTPTVVFLAFGLLGTFAFVYRTGQARLENPELVFLLAVLVLTAIVYFVNRRLTRGSHQRAVLVIMVAILAAGTVYAYFNAGPERSPHQIVSDLLRTTGSSFGPTFRIYLLRLKPALDEAEATFSVVASFNVTDHQKYEGNMNLATPGIGPIYLGRPRQAHLATDRIDRSIFPDATHHWLVNVVPPKGRRCLLIVETTRPDLTEPDIRQIEAATLVLANTLSSYEPGSLPTP